MGKRKVYYDKNGKEIAAYLLESSGLYIEIKNEKGEASHIILSTEDAKDFIIELYRMKRNL